MMMNKMLQKLLIIMLSCFHSLAFADLTNGLVAHWSFDDCAETNNQCEGNTVKDSSGNNHDGKIIGNVNFVDGKVGQAVEFKPYINTLNNSSDIQNDYKNAYIVVPNAGDLNPSNLTVSLWVYNEKEQSSKDVTPLSVILNLSTYNLEECLYLNLAVNCDTTDVAKPSSETSYSDLSIYGLTYFSPSSLRNKYAFNFASSIPNQPATFVYPSGESKVKPKTWYHLTYTYDNTTKRVRVYYNGREVAGTTLKAEKTLVEGVNNTIFKMGYPAVEGGFKDSSQAKATHLQFEGKLDELRIYNRVLTKNEIQTLYTQQLVLPPKAMYSSATFTVTVSKQQRSVGNSDLIKEKLCKSKKLLNCNTTTPLQKTVNSSTSTPNATKEIRSGVNDFYTADSFFVSDKVNASMGVAEITQINGIKYIKIGGYFVDAFSLLTYLAEGRYDKAVVKVGEKVVATFIPQIATVLAIKDVSSVLFNSVSKAVEDGTFNTVRNILREHNVHTYTTGIPDKPDFVGIRNKKPYLTVHTL